MQRVLPICLLGIFLAAGCDSGPRYIPVKGKVSLDGKPIEVGLVHFEAVDGKSPSAKGGTIANGEYSAEVPAGEHIVKVTGSKVVGKYKVYEEAPDSPIKEVYQQFVPSQFNAETTLKVIIAAKKDDLDFILKSQ